MGRYQDAGVDVTAGYELVRKIKDDVASTERLGVLGGIGSFGGMFDLTALQVKNPVLVSGTDGVGTKLLIAQKAKKAGVECVVFDRGGFLYHGRVAALADAAREAGLMF